MRSTSTQASEPAAAIPHPDGFPQVFGKYVLLRPMARGGMGELFLAAAGETGGFEKLCVVKKVLHNLGDQAVHRRFLDEAKVVVRLNHGNLVQVFDAGRVDNDYYLAMELIEGKDLRAVWNRCAQLHRRIPVDFAIFIIREILRGLDYVHDAMALDLVHRDISPPNILIGYHGQVKITDFGLAKSAIKREMTSPGVVYGRYSYLSPEQARGQPADRRTDIYAAAIVMWELLTGRQLFPSSNRGHAEALAAVRNPKIRPPSELVPGIPVGFDDIVCKALATDRDKRYATAGAFRVALSEILARDFPTCDADRVNALMGEIFARERKVESEDYANYAREDFSAIRAQGHYSEAISISDVIVLDESGKKQDITATIPLSEHDIVELEELQRHASPATRSSSVSDAPEARIGQVLAQRYRVDALLGVGRMGAVYRVTHLALGKPLALKVFHPAYSRSTDAVARFMREARAATQTGHPNIVDVVDVGSLGTGDVYVVMELLEGRDLATLLAEEGALAVRRAVHIGRQIARALAAAHDAGIVHRDLRPDSVMLLGRGNDPDSVKILDFGAAARADKDPVDGDYVAPEQGSGQDGTSASDVYSLGCILFEMLTGNRPHLGRTPEHIRQQKRLHDPPPVGSLRSDCPQSLSDVVARALSRDPTVRQASMRVLEYELTRAMDGRASAVAAVLGIKLGEHAERAGESHSGVSAPRIRRSAMEAAAPMLVPGMDSSPLPASSSGTMSRLQVVRPSASMTNRMSTPWAHVLEALKALFFVILGGSLVVGIVLAVRPDLVKRDEAVTTTEAVSPDPSTSAIPVASAVPAVAVRPPPISIPSMATREVEKDPRKDVRAIVARAEKALQNKHWREPAEGSLVIELQNLSVVEPGHESFARLRKKAADGLLRSGEKAAKRLKWQDAAKHYRDLISIWPDNEPARSGLVAALGELATEQAQAEDFEGALVSSDELLNLVPNSFPAALVRADALAALKRWEQAKLAYERAVQLEPRNKQARAGLALAKRRAGTAARKRD